MNKSNAKSKSLKNKFIKRIPNNDEDNPKGDTKIMRDLTASKNAEDNLKESKKRFKALIEKSSDVIALSDTQGNYSYVTPSIEKVLGYTAEEFIKLNGFEIMHPEDIGRVEEQFKELLENPGHSATVELRGKHKDGSWRWIQATATNLINESYVKGIVSNFRDITEHKLADDEVKYRTALLEAQNEVTPDAILVVSPEGKMLYHNQGFIDIWKIPQEIIESKEDNAALEYATSQVVDPQAFIERVNYLYKNPDEIAHEEVLFKDGRIIDRYGVAVKGSDGTYFGWAWYFRDITDRKQTELKLRESEQSFKIIADAAPNFVWMLNADGSINYLNDYGLKFFGVPLEKFVADSWLPYVHPDDIEPISHALQKAMSTKSPYRFEHRLKRYDGNYHWVISSANPSLQPNGELNGYIGSAIDITERKNFEIAETLAREKIEESAKRYRNIFESTSVSIWEEDFSQVKTEIEKLRNTGITDFAKYFETNPEFVQKAIGMVKVLDVNKFSLKMFAAQDKKEVLNSLTTIFLPETIEVFKGELFAIANNHSSFESEAVLRKINGEKINVLFSMVFPQDSLDLSSVLVNLIDITARKRVEERQNFLAEASHIISSSLEYKHVLSNIAKMLVPQMADWYSVDLLDEEGNITNATVFHKDPEKIKWAYEIQKKYPIDYNAPNGAPNVIRTGTSEIYEYISDDMLVAAAKDEEQLKLMREIGYTSVIIVPLNIRGRAIGALSLVTTESGRQYNSDDLRFAEDLGGRIAISIDNARLYGELETRVKERTKELEISNEQLTRSNTELQDFAYVASHDLQEPLRKISSFSKLLESKHKSELSEGAQNYLEAINRSSRRMSTLINDLLTFSRVTTKTHPHEIIDLNKTIVEIIDDMQTRIEESNAELKVEELCPIQGDSLQIRLLIQNLISNSIKYSKQNVPPSIHIYSKADKSSCTIFVKDNGIGFDEVYLDKIFTIFQRLHGRTEYEGTGIGLAICKKIVDRHSGTITAKSKEGEGSTFIVKLPLTQKK